jgi:predicted nucleotidyltransferase
MAASRARIEVPRDRIEEFCRKWNVTELSLFGSVLRDDFTDKSDVDVLVQFAPGTSVGLEFFAMERELSEILGRKVDLNTRGFLSPRFERTIIAEREILVDQA